MVTVARAMGGAPGRAANAVNMDVEERGRKAGRDGEDSSVLGEEDPYVRCAGGDGFERLTGPCNGDSAASADRKHKDSAGVECFTNGGTKRFAVGERTSNGGRVAGLGAEVAEHKASCFGSARGEEASDGMLGLIAWYFWGRARAGISSGRWHMPNVKGATTVGFCVSVREGLGPEFPNGSLVSIESVALRWRIFVAARDSVTVGGGDAADLGVGGALAAYGFAVVGGRDV